MLPPAWIETVQQDLTRNNAARSNQKQCSEIIIIQLLKMQQILNMLKDPRGVLNVKPFTVSL